MKEKSIVFFNSNWDGIKKYYIILNDWNIFNEVFKWRNNWFYFFVWPSKYSYVEINNLEDIKKLCWIEDNDDVMIWVYENWDLKVIINWEKYYFEKPAEIDYERVFEIHKDENYNEIIKWEKWVKYIFEKPYFYDKKYIDKYLDYLKKSDIKDNIKNIYDLKEAWFSLSDYEGFITSIETRNRVNFNKIISNDEKFGWVYEFKIKHTIIIKPVDELDELVLRDWLITLKKMKILYYEDWLVELYDWDEKKVVFKKVTH